MSGFPRWFSAWLHGRPREQAAPDAPGPTAGPGPRPAGAPRTRPDAPARDRAPAEVPGARFGLPASGPGAVAGAGWRLGQFLLDLLLAGAVASAVVFPAPSSLSLAVWLVLVGPPVALVGRTPAMALLGMRVALVVDEARVAGTSAVGWRALPRTVSLFFVVPAMIFDEDLRGLHDRVSRTVVLRTR